MANFASTIKHLRTERGITQEQLAAMLKVSRSTIGMYETGSREPDFETCEAIADIFNVDMDYLMGRSNVERKNPITPTTIIPPGFSPMPPMDQVPLVGRVACGTPITAEQNIERYVDVPEGVSCDFCLECEGDSMIDAGIHSGDLVYIRIQPEVENGQIAAVRIGEEATLKKVYYDGESLILMPCNNSMLPRTYSGPALENIKIEGRAVGFTHWFRR